MTFVVSLSLTSTHHSYSSLHPLFNTLLLLRHCTSSVSVYYITIFCSHFVKKITKSYLKWYIKHSIIFKFGPSQGPNFWLVRTAHWRPPGTAFKDQGECIIYIYTKLYNLPMKVNEHSQLSCYPPYMGRKNSIAIQVWFVYFHIMFFFFWRVYIGQSHPGYSLQKNSCINISLKSVATTKVMSIYRHNRG